MARQKPLQEQALSFHVDTKGGRTSDQPWKVLATNLSQDAATSRAASISGQYPFVRVCRGAGAEEVYKAFFKGKDITAVVAGGIWEEAAEKGRLVEGKVMRQKDKQLAVREAIIHLEAFEEYSNEMRKIGRGSGGNAGYRRQYPTDFVIGLLKNLETQV